MWLGTYVFDVLQTWIRYLNVEYKLDVNDGCVTKQIFIYTYMICIDRISKKFSKYYINWQFDKTRLLNNSTNEVKNDVQTTCPEFVLTLCLTCTTHVYSNYYKTYIIIC